MFLTVIRTLWPESSDPLIGVMLMPAPKPPCSFCTCACQSTLSGPSLVNRSVALLFDLQLNAMLVGETTNQFVTGVGVAVGGTRVAVGSGVTVC